MTDRRYLSDEAMEILSHKGLRIKSLGSIDTRLVTAAILEPTERAPSQEAALDTIESYFVRQSEWSARTFGPGTRTNGIVEHIRKELEEVLANPHDLTEWIDLTMLAMDGFWRHGGKPEEILSWLNAKQKKNFARKWQTPQDDKAVEHVRDDPAGSQPAPPVCTCKMRQSTSAYGMHGGVIIESDGCDIHGSKAQPAPRAEELDIPQSLELCAKATAPPWRFARSGGQDCIWLDIVAGNDDEEILSGPTQPQPHIVHADSRTQTDTETAQAIADLKFVEAARTALPIALKRLQAAEAQVSSLTEALDLVTSQLRVKEMCAVAAAQEVDSLRSQLESAKADGARLDWLETNGLPDDSHPNSTFEIGDTAKFPWGAARLIDTSDGLKWEKLDWRMAIDAAMSTEKEKR